jgi:transcriptional regulator with XRE-family HTH domain
MHELRRRIGQRIAAALVDNDMTQADLADRLGVRPATVSRWIAGVNPIGLDELEATARVFSSTIADLLPPEEQIAASEYRVAWGALDAMRPAERQALIEGIAAVARAMREHQSSPNTRARIERVS